MEEHREKVGTIHFIADTHLVISIPLGVGNVMMNKVYSSTSIPVGNLWGIYEQAWSALHQTPGSKSLLKASFESRRNVDAVMKA